ncbi:hypothetical protein D3C87_1868840 [compost metagenome]
MACDMADARAQLVAAVARNGGLPNRQDGGIPFQTRPDRGSHQRPASLVGWRGNLSRLPQGQQPAQGVGTAG